MSKKATLLKRIEAFLSEPRKAKPGDWPDVTDADMEQLRDIVGRLIDLKFERDVDGDAPVEAVLVDRTRFERPMHIPVRYTHRAVDGRSELELHLAAAESHGLMARFHAERNETELRAAQMLLREASSEHRPLQLGGVRYVAKLPEGVTLESVRLAAYGALMAAWKKAIAPEDFNQRQTWARAVAEDASKRSGVKVLARTCMHCSEGVRMYVDVPAFDTSIKLVTGVEPGRDGSTG